MKKIIKIITIILSISVILSIPASTTAIHTEPIEENSSDLSFEIYADNIIFEMVETAEITYSDLYISQMYNICDNTQKLFFAFDNSTCIGYLLVNYSNNQYSSSFIPKQLPIVSQSLLSDYPLAFISREDSLLALTPKIGVFDFTLEQLEPINNISVSESITVQTIRLKRILPPVPNDVELNRVEPFDVQLNVPYVGVGWSPNGTSLCWASAICSIAAYRLNDSTPMTARQLYDALASAYPEDGTPKGEDIHVLNAFLYFGFYNYNLYNCGLTISQIKTALDNGRPIFVGMSTSNHSSNHAVALCGARRTISNSIYYTVMDHQLQKVVCHQPSSGAFSITIGNTTYTEWECAVW